MFRSLGAAAVKCLSLLRAELSSTCKVGTEPPAVRCAKMVILSGKPTCDDIKKIENYLINPVDSRLTDDKTIPETLKIKSENPGDIPVVEGFIKWAEPELESYRQKMGLAMDLLDIKFLQDYFKSENRDPPEPENCKKRWSPFPPTTMGKI